MMLIYHDFYRYLNKCIHGRTVTCVINVPDIVNCRSLSENNSFTRARHFRIEIWVEKFIYFFFIETQINNHRTVQDEREYVFFFFL